MKRIHATIAVVMGALAASAAPSGALAQTPDGPPPVHEFEMGTIETGLTLVHVDEMEGTTDVTCTHPSCPAHRHYRMRYTEEEAANELLRHDRRHRQHPVRPIRFLRIFLCRTLQIAWIFPDDLRTQTPDGPPTSSALRIATEDAFRFADASARSAGPTLLDEAFPLSLPSSDFAPLDGYEIASLGFPTAAPLRAEGR